jgi:hypothetical protein
LAGEAAKTASKTAIYKFTGIKLEIPGNLSQMVFSFAVKTNKGKK